MAKTPLRTIGANMAVVTAAKIMASSRLTNVTVTGMGGRRLTIWMLTGYMAKGPSRDWGSVANLFKP